MLCWHKFILWLFANYIHTYPITKVDIDKVCANLFDSITFPILTLATTLLALILTRQNWWQRMTVTRWIIYMIVDKAIDDPKIFQNIWNKFYWSCKTNKKCPKNLTFPEAEREQRCPRLVVVIFCLFFSICQSDLSFAGVNQSNS